MFTVGFPSIIYTRAIYIRGQYIYEGKLANAAKRAVFNPPQSQTVDPISSPSCAVRCGKPWPVLKRAVLIKRLPRTDTVSRSVTCTAGQGVFIVEMYVRKKAYNTLRKRFTHTYPESPMLTKSCVSTIFKNWRTTGSVRNKKLHQMLCWP
jgi:hypothetical protein